jgi:hypothetical protein
LDVQQNRLAEETQGDEGAAKLQEGQMNVGAVLAVTIQVPDLIAKQISVSSGSFVSAVEYRPWI